MQGLFVDDAKCLHLVLRTKNAHGAERTVVHGSAHTEQAEWTGVLDGDADGSVRLAVEGARAARVGVFDGADACVWEDGTVWHRLRVSDPQIRILGYRPYVPLSLYAVALVGRLLFVLYRRLCAAVARARVRCA